jgi:hypothetical protein
MPHHHELIMSDVQSPPLRFKIAWLIGVAAAFAIFALIGAYSSRMTNDYPDYDQGRADLRYQTLAKLQHDENALIEPVDEKGNPTAAWVDQTKGTIKIPIEQAMTKVLDTLKSQPAAQGAEIPGTAPAAPPAAPAASTNAAPAAPAAPSTNAPPAKPGKPKPGAAKNAPPAAPDAKVKPASPAASTGSPTVPTPDAPNK